MLTSAYPVLNTSAIRQEHYDHLFVDIEPNQSRFVLQLLFSKKRCINILAVKIVDDVLITGKLPDIQTFMSSVKAKYEMSTIVYGTGEFLFFELQVLQ